MLYLFYQFYACHTIDGHYSQVLLNLSSTYISPSKAILFVIHSWISFSFPDCIGNLSFFVHNQLLHIILLIGIIMHFTMDKSDALLHKNISFTLSPKLFSFSACAKANCCPCPVGTLQIGIERKLSVPLEHNSFHKSWQQKEILNPN